MARQTRAWNSADLLFSAVSGVPGRDDFKIQGSAHAVFQMLMLWPGPNKYGQLHFNIILTRRNYARNYSVFNSNRRLASFSDLYSA